MSRVNPKVFELEYVKSMETHLAPQKSMFRTRYPRQVSAAQHLLLAFVMFVVALATAIFLAEN